MPFSAALSHSEGATCDSTDGSSRAKLCRAPQCRTPAAQRLQQLTLFVCNRHNVLSDRERLIRLTARIPTALGQRTTRTRTTWKPAGGARSTTTQMRPPRTAASCPTSSRTTRRMRIMMPARLTRAEATSRARVEPLSGTGSNCFPTIDLGRHWPSGVGSLGTSEPNSESHCHPNRESAGRS